MRKLIRPIILQFIILAMCMALCFIHQYSFLVGLKFYLYQLCCLLIPGSALSLLIIKKYKNDLEIQLSSYIFGLILTIFEYLIVMLLNLKILYIPIALLLLIVSLFYLYISKERLYKIESTNDWLFCLVLILVVMVIHFFITPLFYMFPTETLGQRNSFFQDYSYWIGNAISLGIKIPMNDFLCVGENFYYHYFSSIFLVHEHFVTGIDYSMLGLNFSIILPSILLVLSCYCLLSKLIKNKVLIVLGIIFCLFTNGFRSVYTYELHFCPLGMDYGLIFGLFEIAYLLEVIDNNKYSAKEIIVSSLLIGICTGLKGSIGSVYLVGFGIVTFKLLLEKRFKEGFTCGFAWLFSFVIIYLVFESTLLGFNYLSASDMSSEYDLQFVGILGCYDINPFVHDVHYELTAVLGLPDCKIVNLLSIFFFVYRYNLVSMTLLIFAFIVIVTKVIKKQDVFKYLVLFFVAISGIFVGTITYQAGNSHLQFYTGAIPISIALGLMCIDEMKLSKTILALLSVILVLISINDMNNFRKYFISYSKKSISLYQKQISDNGFGDYGLTADDYELCVWIRDNTEEEAIISIDSQVGDGYMKSYLIGQFSERFVWYTDNYYQSNSETLRRKNLVESINDNPRENLKILKEEGVTYYIQTLSLGEDVINLNDIVNIVYQNDKFIVYKIK